MAARFGLAFTLVIMLAGSAAAQIVNENFDSYADTAAYRQVWVPTSGNGTALQTNPADIDSSAITNDAVLFPGIQGQAADHLGGTINTPGMVNQYGGVVHQVDGEAPAFQINPTANQSVFLSADIYDPGVGNTERMSVGLRHINVVPDGPDADTLPDIATSNLIELGLWNAGGSSDPTVTGSTPGTATPATPGYYEGTTHAARVALFGARSAPLTVEPTWQFYKLPQELDRTVFGNPPDGTVRQNDVGKGWHRYTATITADSVIFSIDLFRDGLRNTSITPDEVSGIRPGDPGLDAVMVWPIAATSAGFNSLRIGGPSGLTSTGSGVNAFDNVILDLVPTPTPFQQADVTRDRNVDGTDFLLWQRHLGLTAQRTGANGDANADGTVNGADLALWTSQFGTGGSVTPVAGPVPEPGTAGLAIAAMLASLAVVRRR